MTCRNRPLTPMLRSLQAEGGSRGPRAGDRLPPAFRSAIQARQAGPAVGAGPELQAPGWPVRMCPACKHRGLKEASLDTTTSGQAEGAEDGVVRAELPASAASARQARSAVRRALASWSIDDPSGGAELLASELVANAAEHAGSGPIGLALRRHAQPDGQRGITCEVTDTSPIPPRQLQAGPGDERGRAWQSSRPSPPPAAAAPDHEARPPGPPSPSANALTGPPRKSSTRSRPGADPRRRSTSR
jgi:anti-sigma regulatory factor (Ser/Thr protein kinase)